MKPAVSDVVEVKVPVSTSSVQKFALKALPVLLYTLVIVLYTWPLLLHLSDHTPGRFSDDRGLNLEYMWWVKQALTRYHVNPYFTDFLYYPQGVSLYLHTTFLAGAIIALPFQLLWGAVVAFNLLYFIGVVGGAWGAYCLAYYLLANRKAAFLAGLIFAFSPWLNFTSDQNQMNYLLIPWIPFFVLWLIKYLRALYPEYDIAGLTPRISEEFSPARKYRLRYGTLAAIFLTLAAFSGHYIFIYTAFMGAGVALWYLVNLAIRQKWRVVLDLLLKLGLVVLPALVAYLPLLLGIIKEIRSGDFRATSTGFEAGLDIAGLVYKV